MNNETQQYAGEFDPSVDVPETWDEQQGELFKFEKVGAELIGVLLGKEPTPWLNEGQSGTNFVYRFKCPDGVVRSVFGTRLLNNRLLGVSVGRWVKVVYAEDQESNKKGFSATKIFKVYVGKTA